MVHSRTEPQTGPTGADLFMWPEDKQNGPLRLYGAYTSTHIHIVKTHAHTELSVKKTPDI